KETYAILKALDHFRQLVLGSRIIIRTDHLNNLFDKELTKRQQRWKLLLQEFDYKIEHIGGKDNISADVLSRNNLNQKCFKLRQNNEPISKNKKNYLNLPCVYEIEKYLRLASEIYKLRVNKASKDLIYEKLKELHVFLIHPSYKKFINTLSETIEVKGN
ncbi:Transposon Ty3-G Gag-Pol polyprotein, partial [Dictyocoela muelleri]